MEKTAVDDAADASVTDANRYSLTEALGTEDVSLAFYSLDPGEGFSGGMHAHLDQEEVFYVQSGTAVFERLDGDDVSVGAGEIVRFAPGEYQHGFVPEDADEGVEALALGAPNPSTEVRVPSSCGECGHDALAVRFGDDGMSLECPECGSSGSS
ncbi:cupin domain-containing protein [Halocalculus aciditolerans]|uniref:Cupin n=1 Tax=Halocalculus aciditolerans TaxID=1383812 RepID=A0A830FJ14_9EURY|nr:cupin domain-containing protein [Halocalculus aciditolerans]GGL51869.1 cupin [Halocalculus aciditolerans]